MLQNPHPYASAADHPDEVTAQDVCRDWYQQYGTALYGFLRFHLSSPELAEDLTSEVFLRALKAFDRFNASAGSPRAWLFRIAQNALRDHQRQADRRRMVPMTAMWDLESTGPSPEERLLWEEEVSALLTAMTELTASDRQVIGLCYGSEMSVAEAAEILGLTDTATRTRLWRALGRLRKAIIR